MKKWGLMMVVMVLAACGSSGGGGETPEQAAENSLKGIANVIQALGDFSTCTQAGNTFTCPCSGGGTITVTAEGLVLADLAKALYNGTLSNCQDSEMGLSYTGTLSLNDTTGDISLDFSTFGECSNIDGTGTVPMGSANECSGTVTGTCAGATYTCSLTMGASGDCECL
jgi:hypothetical protein